MATMLRVLVAAALALALALPAVGDEGGENTGGMGVWVLPRWSFVAAVPGPVRDCRQAHPIGADCVMQISSECGPAAATLVDELSGLPVSLPVSGSLVRIPATLLQALAQSSAPATVVVADSEQRGYVMTITFGAPGTATISVH
jgi:hypothetical protein